MWLTPKLISECTSNSNFSANHEDNENDQDNENHPDNENEGNYRPNKTNTCSKSTIERKFWCLYDKLWTYFTPCSSVLNADFEHVVIHRVVFFHYKHQRFYIFGIENLIFLLSLRMIAF